MLAEMQTRRQIRNLQQSLNDETNADCLFACFLSQIEPKKTIEALKDPSWVEAMQEELKEAFRLYDREGS